jgi:3-deoxy-D-arabino-heptulosonate 7-phosphate (DAHP) synthase class II
MRCIINSIGVMVSGGTTPDLLLALVEQLNPAREYGRLVLIHRFGADQIARELPEKRAGLRDVLAQTQQLITTGPSTDVMR